MFIIYQLICHNIYFILISSRIFCDVVVDILNSGISELYKAANYYDLVNEEFPLVFLLFGLKTTHIMLSNN